jgi:hypothetical protein
MILIITHIVVDCVIQQLLVRLDGLVLVVNTSVTVPTQSVIMTAHVNDVREAGLVQAASTVWFQQLCLYFRVHVYII